MFKKFMAVTATAAIAASMSISAFADPITPATGEITVTSTKTPTAAQYTVMLFKGEATATSVGRRYLLHKPRWKFDRSCYGNEG